MIGSEAGWTGSFTRNQVEGAILNGKRFVKVGHEAGDAHPLGAGGTVLGSIRAPDDTGTVVTAYFVEFDDMPKTAIGILDWKIEEAS